MMMVMNLIENVHPLFLTVMFAVVTALYLTEQNKLGTLVLDIAGFLVLCRLYFHFHYLGSTLGGVVLGAVLGYLGYRAVYRFLILRERRQQDDFRSQGKQKKGADHQETQSQGAKRAAWMMDGLCQPYDHTLRAWAEICHVSAVSCKKASPLYR